MNEKERKHLLDSYVLTQNSDDGTCGPRSCGMCPIQSDCDELNLMIGTTSYKLDKLKLIKEKLAEDFP